MRATHEWTLMFEVTEHERFATDIVEQAGEIAGRHVSVIGRQAFPDAQVLYVVGRDEAIKTARDRLAEALRRDVEVAYLGRSPGSWRRYRLAPGVWSLCVQRDPGGWHVTLGRWAWTTEVESR